MLNKSVNFGILALLVGLTLSNSGVQAQHIHKQPSQPHNSHDSTLPMSEQMGDQHFLKMMVHHEQKTLKMLDLAIEKAKNPELKTLTTYIKVAQNQELDQLQNLYKQVYGSEIASTQMNCMGAMGSTDGKVSMMDLASLANSPNFDQEFVKKIIHHQQMSVKMATKAAKNANSPQIRNLAEAMIKTQTDQIQKFQKLVVKS